MVHRHTSRPKHRPQHPPITGADMRKPKFVFRDSGRTVGRSSSCISESQREGCDVGDAPPIRLRRESSIVHPVTASCPRAVFVVHPTTSSAPNPDRGRGPHWCPEVERALPVMPDLSETLGGSPSKVKGGGAGCRLRFGRAPNVTACRSSTLHLAATCHG
jgi:hypothetical protein